MTCGATPSSKSRAACSSRAWNTGVGMPLYCAAPSTTIASAGDRSSTRATDHTRNEMNPGMTRHNSSAMARSQPTALDTARSGDRVVLLTRPVCQGSPSAPDQALGEVPLDLVDRHALLRHGVSLTDGHG